MIMTPMIETNQINFPLAKMSVSNRKKETEKEEISSEREIYMKQFKTWFN